MLIGLGKQTKKVVASAFASVTGGTLFSDSTYYYTAFKTTGSNQLIIANANLAVDMLSIGGGGYGNSGSFGGGAGAGSVDLTSLTLTPGTYDALVGAAQQDTSLIKDSSAIFTSHAGGDGAAGIRGASAGGGNGGSVSNPGGVYTFGNAAGYLGNSGGAGQGGTSTVRKGGGGGGMGAAGSAPSGSKAGNGGVGIATYSDICAAVGIGENIGGVYYLGGGGGGGRGVTQNQHGDSGYGIGANTGGGGNGGSRDNAGYSGVIVLRYLKSAVE